MDQEQAKQVDKQARSFCYQFENGAISLSEFLFAIIALEAANRDLITEQWREEAKQAEADSQWSGRYY